MQVQKRAREEAERLVKAAEAEMLRAKAEAQGDLGSAKELAAGILAAAQEVGRLAQQTEESSAAATAEVRMGGQTPRRHWGPREHDVALSLHACFLPAIYCLENLRSAFFVSPSSCLPGLPS